MDIVMQQTIIESINEGRTKQEFLKAAAYVVPDEIGQLWIGRGWAKAAAREASIVKRPANDERRTTNDARKE